MRKPSAKMCVNRVTVKKQRVEENTKTIPIKKHDDDGDSSSSGGGNGDNNNRTIYWMDMNSHDKMRYIQYDTLCICIQW